MENRDVLSRIAPPPDRTIRYTDGADGVIDLWIAGVEAPLVVLWHGGFWRAEYDRIHIRPLATALREAGFTVATPEYRRTSVDQLGWPEIFDDVALATDLLPDLIRREGMAPQAVIHAGHSAGGHLAIWTARRHLLPSDCPWALNVPPAIAGVLALAPVVDLAEAFRLDLDGGAVQALLGGDAGEYPARYAASDPMRIGGSTPPVAILHGDADGRVPIALSRRYAAAGLCTLEELPGADHFATIDPESAAWTSVVRTLRTFTETASCMDPKERR